MTLTEEDENELNRLVDVELRRRTVPPYRPQWDLIVCRCHGNRMYDDNGKPVRCHKWWQL